MSDPDNNSEEPQQPSQESMGVLTISLCMAAFAFAVALVIAANNDPFKDTRFIDPPTAEQKELHDLVVSGKLTAPSEQIAVTTGTPVVKMEALTNDPDGRTPSEDRLAEIMEAYVGGK